MGGETLPDFARIYEIHHRRVLAYAAKHLGSDEAQDVAQEVFAKIARSLGTLADPTKLAPWIDAITRNTVRDAARRRSTRVDRADARAGRGPQDAENDAVLARVVHTGGRTPEERAIRSEMVECYLGYVRRLPPNYREVYV